MKNKIDRKEFLKLYEIGSTDLDIATRLKCSKASVRRIRKKFQLPPLKKYHTATAFQKAVLVGTLLGDGHLSHKEGTNPKGKLEHSQKQKEYLKYKSRLLEGLTGKYTEKDRFDKRTKKIYKTCWAYLPTNPLFNEIYPMLYIDKKKIINKKLLEDYFTDVSLSILFQDDGHGTKYNSFEISLNAFSFNCLSILLEFLKSKFNIECTIRSDKRIYVKRKSADIFYNIIKPYIHSSLEYKVAQFKPR